MDKFGKTLYDCTYKNDKQYSGSKCLQTWSNATYRGSMKNGQYHGEGVFSWNDGRKFVGTFKNGIGAGKQYRVDGSSYNSTIDLS